MEVKIIENSEFQDLIQLIQRLREDVRALQNATDFENSWLTITEVCSLLKVSKRTLHNYFNANILPRTKNGGKVYVRHSDVLNMLEQNYHNGEV